MITYLSAPRWVVVVAATAVIGLAGCTTTKIADEQYIAIGLEPQHQALQHVASVDLLPLVNSTTRAFFTMGPYRGSVVDYDVRTSSTTGTATHDLTGHNVANYRYEERGIVVESEIDYGEKANVRYEPPLLLMPAVFREGEVYESEAVATVYDIHTDERKKAGQIEMAVTILGATEVRTPAGTFNAVIVRTKRVISFGLIRIEINQHEALAPGIGRIANRIRRKASLLGIPILEREDEVRMTRQSK